MICPRCGHNDPNAVKFCSMCGSHLISERPAKRKDPPGSGVVMMARTAAVLIVAVSAFFLLFPIERDPTVTLNSPGFSDRSTVNRNGFVDPFWLEKAEGRLPPNGDLNFAGWYLEPSHETLFDRFAPIRSNTVLYASWNELDLKLTTSASLSPNRTNCTFSNETSTLTSNTTWTVKDAFKTSTPLGGEKISFTGSGDTLKMDLRPGSYEVTMTSTVSGTEKEITRTLPVNGSVKETFTWQDYDYKSRTITYGIDDVNEYIDLAKKNMGRNFRIPDIAGFVAVTGSVQKIADSFKAMFAAEPGLTEQDKMNILASFMIAKSWASDSDYYYVKGLHTAQREGAVEYYKYPIEAIYDTILYGSQGDCDCKAILLAAIAKAFGFNDVAIITITGAEGHAVAGIYDPSFERIPMTGGSTFFLEPDRVKGYFASEVNQGRWTLGNINVKYRTGYTITAWPVSA